MEIRPLVPEDHAAWDRFAASSPDAWFWHTTAWLTYTREYSGAAFRKDLSFWVMAQDTPLAIVPALLEEGPAGPRLAFAGQALPFPAAEPTMGSEKRAEVRRFAVSALQEIAAREKAASFQLRIPGVAASVLESPLPPANPMIRLGALDLPFQTQVIDLRQDEALLFGSMRDGHRYDIRKAERTLTSRVWTASDITDEKFKEYQQLHAKDAGRVTRAQATFDLMRGWLGSGSAALVEVRKGDAPAAFALILLHGKGAYYGSSCKDPDDPKLPASHLAQWAAIQFLKKSGAAFYDIGIQQFGPQWFDRPSPKDIGISRFKRGFGGTTVPLFTGEFHPDEAGLRAAIERRISLL